MSFAIVVISNIPEAGRAERHKAMPAMRLRRFTSKKQVGLQQDLYYTEENTGAEIRNFLEDFRVNGELVEGAT